MSLPSDIAETSVKLPETITGETQKHLVGLIGELTSSGTEQIHIDCTGLSLLSKEHIWLLLQIQTQCQMQGITVILSAPTLSLFNIETLGSLIEASSTLTKRVGHTTPRETSVPAPQPVTTAPAGDAVQLNQRVHVRAADLARSTREFESFLSRLKVEKVDRYVLRTLYTEAVQNIYRHAGLKDSQEIDIHVERAGSCVSMTFVDEGPQFDPTADSAVHEQISDPTAVEFPHFGIKMLKRLADDITYQRSRAGKNVLRIIKELQI